MSLMRKMEIVKKNDDSDDYKIIPSPLQDTINSYNCLLKNASFSIKTSNE